ncbi:uncharacterized protein LOC5521505 isoform X2 [Nematostella vectensis]|uniref:uncharacterized protein LOC5521505 isoform X2 n=1 Tax=Nematostella vectensis TaxID=45351 RepID=UPI0020771E3F|nr:uncharacterized protein LOC5521505 isoform X2 [Nematostella vectensis]
MASRLMNMIEEKTKPHYPESFGKVSSHWKLIRDSVKKGPAEDLKVVDKKQPRNVGHGVHPLRNIPSEEGIETVVYNSFNGNYVCISPEGEVTLCLPSGYKEGFNKYLSQPICGVVYAAKTRQFVGWGKDENIKLMTENFKVISVTSTVSQIHCGIFNDSTNEIITGGTGNITCWSFRYGAKFLLQRKVITEQIPKSCIISHMCLEDTPSRTQRSFAAYDNNIIAHTLLDGTCVAHYKDLHSREITAVLFFNPLKYLITAARDGSIKVWDDTGNVKIIFIGHLKAVNTLAIYPFGSYIMSGSSDNTIRVWSLDMSDEVNRIHTNQPVKGLGSVVGKDNLFSFCRNSLDLWKIEHVHSVFTTIGCKVKSIRNTTHPRVPGRMVCICSDATVRLISPGSGACVTTLLVPGMQTIADVTCAAADNLLFALLVNGAILKASTLTNPCKIMEEWKKEDTGVPSTCNCLCLYEYVVEDKLENDAWGGLVSNLQSRQSSYDRTLLLGGCVDGTIVVFDWQSRKTPGRVSFQIEAHREEVVAMVANPTVDQVISAGMDNSIKVWRLFPFAEEALAPLMTFYCQETPRHLSVAHHRLCVALHEPATASYNIVVFKTTQKDRFDHNNDNDHTDEITGVASCPKMRLFASCGLDGSLRIWDEANNLLRVITLNATPTSLSFCSQKGDLLVGIGNHLHKIEYATYMPRSYIYRMVAMEFQRPCAEKPLPIEESVSDVMSSNDRQRLTRAKSSVYKFTHFADLLSPEEMNERVEEEERRSKAFSKLQERENELQKLRDGVFEFQKRKPRPNSELVKRDGFQKYLEIFYKRPDVEIPEEDEFYKEKSPQFEEVDTFAPNRRPTGFFGIDMNAIQKKSEPGEPVKPEIMCLSMPDFKPRERPSSPPKEDIEEGARDYVVSREGFTPSDLEMEDADAGVRSRKSTSRAYTAPLNRRVMEIGPPLIDRDRYIVDVPKTERYPSSTHCRHQVAQKLARMASRQARMEDDEVFVIAPDGFIPNSVVVSLFKDLKSKELVEETRVWKPPSLTAEQLAEIEKRKKKMSKTPDEEPVVPKKKPQKSNFADQLKLAMWDIPSPEPLPEVDIMRSPTPTPPPSPPPKEPTPPPSSNSSPVKEIKPKKPIEKFISRPKPPTPPPPTPPREPTPPPPPPTPLPEFITQFKGSLWFEKFYPDAQPDTFPKPWTVSSFVKELLKLLPKCSDYELKTQILAAMMLLNRQEPLGRECSQHMSRVLISELNTPDPPTAHGASVAKQFLKVDMQLLQAMQIYNVSLVAELMGQYIDGDEEVRKFVQEMFVTIGIHDPGSFFPQELDSFNTQDIVGTRRKPRVREMCLSWLDAWLSRFKQHIRSLAGKISRAQAGSVVKGTKSPKTPSFVKGILKKDEESEPSPRPPGVKFDMETLGTVAADTATPVEAVNYFCEMRMQEELEKAKARARVKTPPQAKDNSRNTVLILPKINSKRSLVRLGETHCSHCHPERETSLSLAFPLPPIYAHRKDIPLTNVSLRLKTLTLNPFPEPADIQLYEAARHAQLLTLRSAQKYFIPAQSYVRSEPMDS